MTTLAVLLIINGIWNVVVWPAFFRRVLRDPRSRNAGRASRFLVVHAILVGVSLLLAAVSLVLGVVGLLG